MATESQVRDRATIIHDLETQLSVLNAEHKNTKQNKSVIKDYKDKMYELLVKRLDVMEDLEHHQLCLILENKLYVQTRLDYLQNIKLVNRNVIELLILQKNMEFYNNLQNKAPNIVYKIPMITTVYTLQHMITEKQDSMTDSELTDYNDLLKLSPTLNEDEIVDKNVLSYINMDITYERSEC